MKFGWHHKLIIWVLTIVMCIIGIELLYFADQYYGLPTSPPDQQQGDQPNGGGSGNNDDGNKDGDSNQLVWGIDTAKSINDSTYQCIKDNYGKPTFAGRYLGDKKGVSTGITKSEANDLHDKGIKILPIYNHFTDATGRDKGKAEANKAVNLAKDLDIPKGVYIVGDIEPKYDVNAEFLSGWTKALMDSKYKAGIYGDLRDDNLKNVYKNALEKNKDVVSHLMLWTNSPTPGISNKSDAPKDFKGKSPNKEKTLVWQYGIDDDQCNIDTDIGKGHLLNSLW